MYATHKKKCNCPEINATKLLMTTTATHPASFPHKQTLSFF